jgi:hypothetical protein
MVTGTRLNLSLYVGCLSCSGLLWCLFFSPSTSTTGLVKRFLGKWKFPGNGFRTSDAEVYSHWIHMCAAFLHLQWRSFFRKEIDIYSYSWVTNVLFILMFALKFALGFLHCLSALNILLRYFYADKKHLLLKNAACNVSHAMFKSLPVIRLIHYSAILPVLLQLMHVFTYGESKAKRCTLSCPAHIL